MKLRKALPKLFLQLSRFCYVTHTLSHDTIFFHTSISVIVGHGFPPDLHLKSYKYRILSDESLIFLTRGFLLPNTGPKGLMQMKILLEFMCL